MELLRRSRSAHEQVIADEQRVLHGSGRDDTGLADGSFHKKKNEDDQNQAIASRRTFLFLL